MNGAVPSNVPRREGGDRRLSGRVGLSRAPRMPRGSPIAVASPWGSSAQVGAVRRCRHDPHAGARPVLTFRRSNVNSVYMRAEIPDTRARLLEHARDVYLEGGPTHFSLREVARRSGVSAAAVYRHFDGKEALLASVCAEGFRTFSSYLLRALSAPTQIERLRAAADHYRRFAMENARDYRVIFMSTAEDFGGVSGQRGSRETSPTFQFLVDRVRDCVAAEAIAPGDADETAAVIWAHVHGLVSLRLSGHLASVGDDAAFARFFRTSTDRLLAGLAP